MNKYGRGAGGHMQRKPLSASNRGVAPLRRNSIAPKERTAAGAAKGSITNGGNAAPLNPTEETCQLLPSASGAPPPFAMMIRLTPEILEELKRAEEEGAKSVMKFGNTFSGHVIKVGNDEFKFSSVLEPGDLCDIYEEKRHGEDAQGLLVEAGSVWRKLSLLRILSASEKDRVKKRSQEAEQKQKSRKAIILDHSGSLLSTQTTSTATATDANARRLSLKTMKEPPIKKRKIESPIMTAVKPRTQSTIPPLSNNRTLSPVPLSPVQGPSTSLAGGMPPPKGHSTSEERNVDSPNNKGNTAVLKDKISISDLAAAVESGGHAKTGIAVNMTELRSLLIILLKENPKGMTIKAIEKALGEVMPSANTERKNIEKVIKLIATYQAPGKYLLNEGLDQGTSKPSLSNARERPKNHDMSEFGEPLWSTEVEKISARNDGCTIHMLDEQKSALVRAESINKAANKLLGSKKYENSSAKSAAAVSTDASDTSSSSETGSGSDTDSESSGSGSGSDTGSGSRSDSDSEASSSSSEDNNMDEDVDIMSEDETTLDVRQKQKLKGVKPFLSKQDVRLKGPPREMQNGDSKFISSGLDEMPVASNDSKDLDTRDALEDGTVDKMTSDLVKQVFGSEEDPDMAVQVEVISFEGDQKSCEPKSYNTADEKDENARAKMVESHIEDISFGDRKISSQMPQSCQDKGRAKHINELGYNIEVETRDKKENIRMCEKGDTHIDNEPISGKNERRSSILGGKAVTQEEKDGLSSGLKGQVTRKSLEMLQRVEPVDAKMQRSDATIYNAPSGRGLPESLELGKMQFSGSPARGKDNTHQMEKFGKEDAFSKQVLESRKSSATDLAEAGKLVRSVESLYSHKRLPESISKDRPANQQQHLSRFATNVETFGRLHPEEDSVIESTESTMKSSKDQELLGSKGKYVDTQSKERMHGSVNHVPMKQTETIGRLHRDTQSQHIQQKELALFGLPGKSNVQSIHISKDPEQSMRPDRDADHIKPNKDSGKAMRSGRPADEVKKGDIDMMEHLEKVERPQREPGFQMRAKESTSDSGGRMLHNGIKEVRNKNLECERLLPSGAMTSNLEVERSAHYLELGELRKQMHEDETQPPKMVPISCTKDSKGIHGFDTSGRIVTKKDEGFNILEKCQPAHRTGKPSPILSISDVGNSLQDSRNGKRRSDRNESSDLERLDSKRVPPQQQQCRQETLASGACSRPAAMEITTSSPFDRQDGPRRAMKKGVLENSFEQDFKEHGHEISSNKLSDNRGSISESQKLRSNPARESPKVEPFSHQSKKQTPTSSEVHGGDFFASYEKKVPQLLGSIKSYEQYKEYREEYHEKYPIYYRLHTALESDKSDFDLFRRDIEQAKSKGDEKKLVVIYEKVRKDYLQCRKRFKRMRHTFLLLHEELQNIKQRCIEYAEKLGQR